MSTTAKEILMVFDTLPESERDEIVAALLSRRPIGSGDLTDAAYEELANELFLTYDAAEAADAAPPD